MGKMSLAELRIKIPGRPESFYQLNASDSQARGPVVALPYVPRPTTMEERVCASLETDNQQEIVKWWDESAPRLGFPEIVLMAFPLQGKRSPKNGARMKAEGLRAGTWDMLLAVPRFPFAGLWIENKTKLGTLSPEQVVFGDAMRAQQFATTVCRSPGEATQQILDFLALP